VQSCDPVMLQKCSWTDSKLTGEKARADNSGRRC